MDKPVCVLTGTDGNVFSILAKVAKTLRKAGLREQAEEFSNKAMNAGSYDEVLQLAFEYVEVE